MIDKKQLVEDINYLIAQATVHGSDSCLGEVNKEGLLRSMERLRQTWQLDAYEIKQCGIPDTIDHRSV